MLLHFPAFLNNLQLCFEILMVFLVSYNALSRPRGPERPLARVLYRDGLLFFVVSGRHRCAIWHAHSSRPTLGRRVTSRVESCILDHFCAWAYRLPCVVRADF